MRAAPAFELTLGLSGVERALLALLGAAVAVALAAWVWSHVDAAAGPTGRGVWPWLAVVPIAAGVGARIAWRVARSQPRTLRWHGHWTWTDSGIEHECTVQPKLDLGSWLLLVLRRKHGGRTCWATVGRQRAGAAWHPLRATLFAPAATEPGAGEGTPT
jgi:hypothetical protein